MNKTIKLDIDIKWDQWGEQLARRISELSAKSPEAEAMAEAKHAIEFKRRDLINELLKILNKLQYIDINDELELHSSRQAVHHARLALRRIIDNLKGEARDE